MNVRGCRGSSRVEGESFVCFTEGSSLAKQTLMPLGPEKGGGENAVDVRNRKKRGAAGEGDSWFRTHGDPCFFCH